MCVLFIVIILQADSSIFEHNTFEFYANKILKMSAFLRDNYLPGIVEKTLKKNSDIYDDEIAESEKCSEYEKCVYYDNDRECFGQTHDISILKILTKIPSRVGL